MRPRPLRPKNEPLAPESSDAASEAKAGKRKAISSACIPCRKRKSKCDGQLPSCSTCVAVYRTECTYDADSDARRKAALQRESPSHPQQNDALDVIVTSLRSLPENEAFALLQTLRTDPNPVTIADSLRGNLRPTQGYSPQTVDGDYSQEITPKSHSPLEGTPYRATRSPLPSGERHQTYQGSAAPSIWFREPPDVGFIEHLINLYFCWVNPFYGFVWRDHFLHDMAHGRPDFCSSLLLNAMLCFACHYSDRPMARTDLNNPSTAGDFYYAEARRLLDSSDKPSLTTVQALGIMSLREASAGRDSNGYQLAGRCVRMALEIGLHLSVVKDALRPAEAEMRNLVFWAVFNLETSFSMSFGRVSQLPRCAADIESPPMNLHSEVQIWQPYEEQDMLDPASEQPDISMLFADQLSKLSNLTSDMLNTLFAPRERFTPRQLAATYAQYQKWYENLPNALRLENTSLPHVIVLHMQYFGSVLHLFRPYIKLDLRSANLYPRHTCMVCADQISTLMNVLRALYGLRRVCLAVSGLLLSASTIHLLNLPNEPAATNLSQALQDLEAMSTNHRFAARCVDIVRALSSKWNVALPEDAAAVTIYRTAARSSDISSSPLSTFFAASIHRKLSSEDRARSGESITNQHDSRFRPPGQPSSPSPFDSNPPTPRDPRAQMPFWTPFPAQGMPVPQQDLGGTTMVDVSQFEGQQPWSPMFGAVPSAGPATDYHQRQPPPLDRLDEDMGEMGGWGWQ